VKHGSFSFLLGDGSKQVPSLQRSNPYSLGDKWSLDINEGHSILNEYSQLDQQEAVVFGKWSLENRSHKEDAKPSSLLKESFMNVRFPQFHMSCKERKSSKKKESYDGKPLT
jgi:hypothetical protein